MVKTNTTMGEGATGNSVPMTAQRRPPGKAAPHSRKLHLGHFAFMRSVVQGVDTRGSWDRYLRLEGEHDDIRNVRRTIQWIRDEFAAAAKRHDRPGTARLVQIDASRIPEKAARLPSLEEFVEEQGLYDFSEAEQLEYYHERYGAQTSNESRRARLIAKQLDALSWLERLEAQAPPKATDPLDTWIHPDLAAHCAAVGIRTIRQLVDRINGLGMRWWAGIPAVGVTKARRVTDWLRANESSIGMRIGAHVNVKRSALGIESLARVVQPATAIVPLEKLVIPAELDGANGLNRAPHHLCQIPVKTDLEAVLSWIRAKQGLSPDEKAALKRKRGKDPSAPETGLAWLDYLSNTQRAYRKEAERFILWTVVERGRALASVAPDDCTAYCGFLANPTPVERWCAPRGREKWSPLWRPFEGPLSPRARRQAVVILKNLFAYLLEKGYLLDNPWATVPTPDADNQTNSTPSISPSQWQLVASRLDQLPVTSARTRMRVALQLADATGLRLSEVVRLRVDDLRRQRYAGAAEQGRGEDGDGWELAVTGKTGRHRTVPIPKNVVNAVSSYLVSRGLSADLCHPANQGVYLIGKAVDVAERAPWAPGEIRDVDPKAGISTATLAKDFRRLTVMS